MENIIDALIVTVIGMGIIFLVLIILLITIVALNKIFPYRADETGDEETIAVIQSAIAAYLKRRPVDVSIKSIK